MIDVGQRHRDAATYRLFVECGHRAVPTAQQLGCTPAEVRARVRRHARRLAVDDLVQPAAPDPGFQVTRG